jgi:uncharacterized protein (TIGR03435 family)
MLAALGNHLWQSTLFKIRKQLDLPRKMLLAAAGQTSVVIPVAYGLLNPTSSIAQAAGELSNALSPTFEVVSIRPDESGGMLQTVKTEFKPDGYAATGVTLPLLLQEAYGINDDRQIVGSPAWLRAKSYTVDARIDGATADKLSKLSDEQRILAQQHMLQALLADRFNLKLHREIKDLPIYALTIAKNGPKLHEAQSGDTYSIGTQWAGGASMGPRTVNYLFVAGNVLMKGQGASLDRLVDRLTQKSTEPAAGPKNRGQHRPHSPL